MRASSGSSRCRSPGAGRPRRRLVPIGRPRGPPRRRGGLPARDEGDPAFLVEDLERMRARVEMSGYKVIESDQFSGFRRVHVRDPFGNRLELIEPV